MSIEGQINGNYLAAHLRLRGVPPKDEHAGEYRKATGESNEALLKKINSLTSQLHELKASFSAHMQFHAVKESKRPKIEVKSGPVESIIQLVCEVENISRNEIISHRRKAHILLPRHIAYYLAYKCTSHSLPQISTSFGDRDHTTIIHGRERIAKLRLIDKELDARLKWYEAKIAANL